MVGLFNLCVISLDHWAQIRTSIETDKEFAEKKNDVKITLLIPYHQVRLIGTRSHVLECESIIKMWLKTFSISVHSSFTSTTACSICLSESDYKLQACGHSYCIKCLKDYFSRFFSGVQVKIECPVDKCGFLLLLRDIKTILRGNDMKKLANASFDAYVKTDEDLVRCPGDKVGPHFSLCIFETIYVCLFFRNKFFVNLNIHCIFHVITV
jgi:hypothetical protein